MGWLALLNFAILKTVISKYILNFNSIIVKNLINGAVVYYPVNTNSLFSVLIIPLFIFNALVIIFLSLSYYFFMKSKKESLKLRSSSINKKAQAAMEFLMTYGWAIMAFIVSIAALAYFGAITTPTGNAICALSPGLNCKEFIVGKDGVLLIIGNGLGVNILDVTANLTNSDQGPCTESFPPKKIADGATESFFVPCKNIKGTNTKFRGDIVIKYRKEGAVLTSTLTGLISTKVADYVFNDTEAPLITLIEPANNQAYAALLFNLIYQVQDYNLSTCWYKLDNQANFNLPTCQNILNIDSGNSGQHILTLFASDKNNNNANKTVSFTTSGTQDTQAPTWSNPLITPSTVNQSDLVRFDTTWADNIQLAGYILSVNQNNMDYVNQSYFVFDSLTNVSSITVQITASSGTIVYWFYFANDTSGNSAVTSTQSFQVSSSGGGKKPIGGG